eukprot:GILI01004618.1.p1 GENE.GILI01004618.1~~GILI01004618.1.p1  ORF type:complete len:295 (-),score=82.48 GILI01004618.1:266-1150(-)
MSRNSVLSGLVLLLCVSYATAWWETGHILVAEIARRDLTPDVDKSVAGLIELFTPMAPNTRDMREASPWADDLKMNGLHAFDTWHYISKPINQDGLPFTDTPIENVLWAVTKCIDTLKRPSNSTFEKSLMLRLLIHFVGDMHQPLHCAELVNRQFPNGDVGGNSYLINYGIYKNVHALWDAGLGVLANVQRPLVGDQLNYITSLAQDLRTKWPRSKLAKELSVELPLWPDQSYHDAATFVYDGLDFNGTPSDAYIQRGWAQVERLLALAGYRLADILNSSLGPQSKKVSFRGSN